MFKWISRRSRRPKPFHGDQFANREEFRSDYRTLASFLLEDLEFDSALDVGCANAFLLEEFQRAGKRIAGVELSEDVLDFLSPAVREAVTIGDFTAARGSWDLVCCVEVAEHLEPHRSEELVATLVETATGLIYFTAALPGQTGRGHINCRPHGEWLAWFTEAGWRVDRGGTDRLRRRMAVLESTPWLRANSFLLVPDELADGQEVE